jgi:hypothetical protein
MVGGNIPSYLPPPSPEACAFFGIDQSEFSDRNKANSNSRLRGGAVSEGDLELGKGFAFGAAFYARLRIDAGVYVEGQIGVGFDVLYTSKGNCGVGTGKGRVYGFVKGEIGIAGIPLVGAGVGLFLEGGLPKPAYFRGIAVLEVTFIVTIRGELDISIGDENTCN